MKILKRVLTAIAAAGLSLSMGVTSVSAKSVYISDDFNRLTAVNPDEGGKWWVLNDGLENGYFMQWNAFNGDGTSVQVKRERGTSFVRLLETPNEVEDNYYNAELADLHTGFAYGTETGLTPTVGHPVTMEARVRWSANYKADGTGGALGSVGIWLWNSPIDFVGGNFYGQDGLGFNWTDQGSVLAPGLNLSVINQSFPEYGVSLTDLNMQRWNTFKMVWGVKANGTQYVDFYVNGCKKGHTDLSTALHDLSVEIWNDNQKPIDFLGTLKYSQATANEAFDVDYIRVIKN